MENKFVALADMKLGATEVFATDLGHDEKKIIKDLSFHEKANIKTAKDPLEKLKQTLSKKRLESMGVHVGLQYNYQGIVDALQGVTASAELCADLPQEMQQSYEALSTEEQDRYQKFFKEKLDKYGAKSPADLDDAKKSQLFDEVKKDWK
jgi:hypothetical protein